MSNWNDKQIIFKVDPMHLHIKLNMQDIANIVWGKKTNRISIKKLNLALKSILALKVFKDYTGRMPDKA